MLKWYAVCVWEVVFAILQVCALSPSFKSTMLTSMYQEKKYFCNPCTNNTWFDHFSLWVWQTKYIVHIRCQEAVPSMLILAQLFAVVKTIHYCNHRLKGKLGEVGCEIKAIIRVSIESYDIIKWGHSFYQQLILQGSIQSWTNSEFNTVIATPDQTKVYIGKTTLFSRSTDLQPNHFHSVT